MPNTVCDDTVKTKLYQLLSDHYGEANLTTVQRKYFNECKGWFLASYVLCFGTFTKSVSLDMSYIFIQVLSIFVVSVHLNLFRSKLKFPQSITVWLLLQLCSSMWSSYKMLCMPQTHSESVSKDQSKQP